MTEHRKPSACHSTAQEIEFITNLGRSAHSRASMSRKQLLVRYRSALEARSAWGNLNRESVIAECDRQIAQAEKRAR